VSIEAWVTDLAGIRLATLDRGQASPFRRFAIQSELNAPGAGSLEYHLDNAIVNGQDDLFAYGNLVWFRYRGKTRAWIVEERVHVLDDQEHATDWVRVSGRGTLQLLGDRTIWPTHYSDTNTDPSLWEFGGWSTKTNASAALGQKVIPVLSTTSGAGASINDPVEIVGGGHRQIGIIDSIVAGVSVTLKDNLAYTFPIGSRVRGAARQWRRFVNRAAGEMLWDNISESASRFTAAVTRGTVETTGVDGWTQDFRFDNQLDVVSAVTKVYGDVEMDGLVFNYRNCQGADRTSSVIFEEGADLLRLQAADSDRDSLSWVVAEGTGHAVFSYLAPKKKLTRAQRKTAARKAALTRRKAPAAPRKVIIVNADYTLDLAAEAVTITRRREAFLDAKDVSDLVQLNALADAALEEHQVTEAVDVEANETRYQVDRDYGLGDWIRVIAPSRGFDENVRVVALAIAEDDSEQVQVVAGVNSTTEDHLLRLAQGAKDTRSSLGVQNRQPQGQLVPFSFSGDGIFDTDDTMETHIYIPDRMYLGIEAKVAIDFRPFFAAARTAASSGLLTSDSGGGSTTVSGGGATSGASSASSSAAAAHKHPMFYANSTTAGGFALKKWTVPVGGGGLADIAASALTDMWTDNDGTGHSHTIAHDHTTPNHTHATPNHQHTVPGHTHTLVFGTQKEAYPGSHSVTLKVYELVDTTWTLRYTSSALTADQEEVDLSSTLISPGKWRLDLYSNAAQPNNGRLAAYVSGYVLGAIQSA
jgi:hypothetical protein